MRITSLVLPRRALVCASIICRLRSCGKRSSPCWQMPSVSAVHYYLEQDRTAETLGICQQGLDRFPQDLNLQMMLAQTSARLGKTNDVRSEERRAGKKCRS